MAIAPFSLRLKPQVKARLEEEARRTERSASFLAGKAIEGYLAAKDDKRAQLEAAIKEADKGIFISSEAIEAWMDSWGTEHELPPPEPDIFP